MSRAARRNAWRETERLWSFDLELSQTRHNLEPWIPEWTGQTEPEIKRVQPKLRNRGGNYKKEQRELLRELAEHLDQNSP